MKQKTAIISGISGQDGSYLAKILFENNYKIIGLTRSYASLNIKGLEYLKINDKVKLIECDLLDITQVINIFNEFEPDEFYNLAAQSSVYQSFKQPIGTFQFNTLSVFNILEAIKIVNIKIKYYQASSSEMYGKVNLLPITENSVLHPLSPYAISKAAAHFTCINYRESYNMFISCGILFNHESYLRSDNFFVKKVLRESIKISKNLQDVLEVGNIDVKRDFGFAPKYAEAMFLMLQQEIPNDYIVCSGTSLSLREIIYYVFDKLKISKEKCVINPKLYRPSDIEDMYGTNEKARKELNWEYKLSFFEVLDILLKEEIENYSIN